MKIGIECEGVYRGMKTLFVDGLEHTVSEVEKILRSNTDVHHIYIGADKTSPDYEIAKILSDVGYLVTVELPLHLAHVFPVDLVGRVRVMFAISVPKMFDWLEQTDMIKIETDNKCHVFLHSSAIVNEKNYLDQTV